MITLVIKKLLQKRLVNIEKLAQLFLKRCGLSALILLTKKLLQGAFDVYPSAWLDYVKKDNRKFFTPKVTRGFFVPGASRDGKYYYDKLPGDIKAVPDHCYEWRGKTTAFHEIGHMVEYYKRYPSHFS